MHSSISSKPLVSRGSGYLFAPQCATDENFESGLTSVFVKPPKSQNINSTHIPKRFLESLQSPRLFEGQRLLLSAPTDQRPCVLKNQQTGITSLAGLFGNDRPDITLAFSYDSSSTWFRLPQDTNLLTDALTVTSLRLDYQDNCPIATDLMWQWLFDLHPVRHPTRGVPHLFALFQLLVTRLVIRRENRYFLPFSLLHSWIADLIVVTLATVTRQIHNLSQKNDLFVQQIEAKLFLFEKIMQTNIIYN